MANSQQNFSCDLFDDTPVDSQSQRSATHSFPDTQTLIGESQSLFGSTGQYPSEHSLIHGSYRFSPNTQDMASANLQFENQLGYWQHLEKMNSKDSTSKCTVATKPSRKRKHTATTSPLTPSNTQTPTPSNTRTATSKQPADEDTNMVSMAATRYILQWYGEEGKRRTTEAKNNHQKSEVWQLATNAVNKTMNTRYSKEAVKAKFHNTKKQYNAVLRHNNKSGRDTAEFELMEECANAFEADFDVHPPLLLDSLQDENSDVGEQTPLAKRLRQKRQEAASALQQEAREERQLHHEASERRHADRQAFRSRLLDTLDRLVDKL